MEIHTPDRAPETWKETAKHLAIITAGVLIALALEGIVAWADHRLLVREARANLLAEVRSNKKELEASLFGNIERERKELEQADRAAQTLIEHGKLDITSLNMSWNFAELKNAAVTTSEITGAFGYMDYAEVRHFADVYDLQAQFLRAQERQVQEFQPIFGFIGRLLDSKPPSQASIEEWRGRINNQLAGLGFEEIVAKALLKRYDELLR